MRAFDRMTWYLARLGDANHADNAVQYGLIAAVTAAAAIKLVGGLSSKSCRKPTAEAISPGNSPDA
jgi:hypothetical protein